MSMHRELGHRRFWWRGFPYSVPSHSLCIIITWALDWNLSHVNATETCQWDVNISLGTVYPKKYAHGFVVLCFVVVIKSFIMNSHEVFIHIHQGCFAGIGAIVRLPQCQWSKPDGYGKISQYITTTKHSKAVTVCIFLGIYCNSNLSQLAIALAHNDPYICRFKKHRFPRYKYHYVNGISSICWLSYKLFWWPRYPPSTFTIRIFRLICGKYNFANEYAMQGMKY